MRDVKLFLPIMAMTLIAVACGGGSDAANPDSGASWSDSANVRLLNQLPDYSGATLVREWEVTQDNEDILVREYAVAIPTEQAVDQVTLYYRAWLLQNGWTEAQPRAAFAAYSKPDSGGGTSRLIIGRIGPQLMETPPNAKSLRRTDPPAGSQFFYTLEMTADWKGSVPR